MTKPARADAECDDASITKCRRYALPCGFGSLFVGNVFAFRATCPANLRLAAASARPEDQHHLLDLALVPETTVVMAQGRIRVPGFAALLVLD